MHMPKGFDAVVIGAGTFGAWTALHLRRRGLRVALVDAHGPAHNRASSGGESRIIRMGYGQNEIYTRSSMRALPRWQELFALTGQPLFHRTGVVWLGRDADHAGGSYLARSLATFERLGVPHQTLSRPELTRLYPQIALNESISWGLLEPESGVLMARRAVAAVVEQAVREGVECQHAAVIPPAAPEGATRLEEVQVEDGQSITAITAIRAIRLALDAAPSGAGGAHGSGVFVFACGPWLGKLFPDLLGDRIFNTRQEVFFFGVPPGDTRFRPPALPTWIDLAEEAYGMPGLDSRGLKLAIDRHGPGFDPDTGSRLPTAEGISQASQYLAKVFPALAGAPVVESRVCQYENTSSGDFLLDRHPTLQNVWLAGGGSGHGFKHGPSVGEYLAGQILDGGPSEPRFSLETKQAVQHRAIF
ncbi:MAG TPA: FAD-dependent oxidoreductase [Terriglobales bacterium]